MSRPTLSELRWPMDDASRRQAENWAASVTPQVLGWTWRAYDALHANVLWRVNISQPLDQLERDLTSKHFIEINRLFAAETDGFSSIVPHHEFPENESAPGGSAKPPASDLSFIWYENQRVSWPIEAKLLRSPGALADYVSDTTKFLNGIVAPFVGEGGQIAYLLHGSPADFFSNLQAKLNKPLVPVDEFAARPHKSCRTKRQNRCDIRLHHMAMPLHAA